MENFIFVTYIIALIALAMALYAVLEVREMKKTERRKVIQRRIEQLTKPVAKSKSHWG